MTTNTEAFLPLTPLSLAVLLAVSDEDLHGYAILKEIERESDGRTRPGTGTLYAALQRMVDEGLLEESSAAPDEDARRRYYGITMLGRDVARAEVRRLERLVHLAAEKRLVTRLRLAGPPRQKG